MIAVFFLPFQVLYPNSDVVLFDSFFPPFPFALPVMYLYLVSSACMPGITHWRRGYHDAA